MSDDFIKATNQHERAMFEERRRADERRREQMNTRIGYIASALVAIVVALIGKAVVLYLHRAHPTAQIAD